jgi:hypothetical protein
LACATGFKTFNNVETAFTHNEFHIKSIPYATGLSNKSR